MIQKDMTWPASCADHHGGGRGRPHPGACLHEPGDHQRHRNQQDEQKGERAGHEGRLTRSVAPILDKDQFTRPDEQGPLRTERKAPPADITLHHEIQVETLYQLEH